MAGRVLDLQRTAGNRAVAGMLAGGGPPPGVLAVQRAPTPPTLQRAPGALRFTDLPIGTNVGGSTVKVTRVLGNAGGYPDRWMATAVARLAKADPAAVVRPTGTDSWYAVATSAALSAGKVGGAQGGDTTKGASTSVSEAYGLPSLAGLPQVAATVTALRKRLDQLRAAKPRDKADKKAIDEELGTVVSQLNRENVRRMALILGVAEAEVKLIATVTGRVSGMINAIGAPDINAPGGSHGPVSGQKDTAFHLDLVTAIAINEDKFDDPGRAQATLFHEAHHLEDIEYAKHWVRTYQTEMKRFWVSGAAGQEPFRTWLTEQVKKKRLTAGDAELVVDESRDVSATTEARANIHTFLTVLQLGDAAQAEKSLRGYARALPPGRQYGAPPNGSSVVSELVAELKAAYQQMPRPMQVDYRRAVTAAIAENRSAWITALKFFR